MRLLFLVSPQPQGFAHVCPVRLDDRGFLFHSAQHTGHVLQTGSGREHHDPPTRIDPALACGPDQAGVSGCSRGLCENSATLSQYRDRRLISLSLALM